MPESISKPAISTPHKLASKVSVLPREEYVVPLRVLQAEFACVVAQIVMDAPDMKCQSGPDAILARSAMPRGANWLPETPMARSCIRRKTTNLSTSA
ncbi:hypothetical protein THI4931_09530 [Pandoraea sputorum]|nr:hypothetical protein THI4931_09530 [Pandoraea sputorum]